jgi:PilZ domain
MNKRSNERHRVLLAGTISFQGSKVDCAVHDLSLAGASVEVDCHAGIPDSFDLLLADTGKRHCRVVWRKAERIGVAFS